MMAGKLEPAVNEMSKLQPNNFKSKIIKILSLIVQQKKYGYNVWYGYTLICLLHCGLRPVVWTELCSPQVYVEAPAPSVTVFGDSALRR